MVDNLLSNVRAHARSDAAVDVTLARANGAVRLSAADTRPGMADEELAHVFERFYRADPSRARAAGGAGLGFSIVAAVAEAHGGTVSATAAEGGGATFVVERCARRLQSDSASPKQVAGLGRRGDHVLGSARGRGVDRGRSDGNGRRTDPAETGG